MSQAAVSAKDVSVVLGGHFEALHKVSVDIAPGKVIGFIGPSGAGKTTLMRVIVGRQKIHSGTVTVLGLPAGSAALRAQMSYMTQATSVYSDLTVTENVRYFAAMFGLRGAARRQAVSDILQIVDMHRQAGQLANSLSGGQLQRLSLAIALIGSPKLMVLDEPTVGLDPVLRERLWSLFHDLVRQGTTLFISSHVMDEAERCDDLLLLRNGEMLAHGSPRELCRQTGTSSVEQSFLKLVEAT